MRVKANIHCCYWRTERVNGTINIGLLNETHIFPLSLRSAYICVQVKQNKDLTLLTSTKAHNSSSASRPFRVRGKFIAPRAKTRADQLSPRPPLDAALIFLYSLSKRSLSTVFATTPGKKNSLAVASLHFRTSTFRRVLICVCFWRLAS